MGNVVSVVIEHDPWLSCDLNPYIITVHEALKSVMVSSLMTEYQNNWNADLVKDIFNDRDANPILTFPIKQKDNDA